MRRFTLRIAVVVAVLVALSAFSRHIVDTGYDQQRDCKFDRRTPPSLVVMACTAVLAKEPDAGWAYSARGSAHDKLRSNDLAFRDYEAAIAIAERELQRDPSRPESYSTLSSLHRSMSSWHLFAQIRAEGEVRERHETGRAHHEAKSRELDARWTEILNARPRSSSQSGTLLSMIPHSLRDAGATAAISAVLAAVLGFLSCWSWREAPRRVLAAAATSAVLFAITGYRANFGDPSSPVSAVLTSWRFYFVDVLDSIAFHFRGLNLDEWLPSFQLSTWIVFAMVGTLGTAAFRIARRYLRVDQVYFHPSAPVSGREWWLGLGCLIGGSVGLLLFFGPLAVCSVHYIEMDNPCRSVVEKLDVARTEYLGTEVELISLALVAGAPVLVWLRAGRRQHWQWVLCWSVVVAALLAYAYQKALLWPGDLYTLALLCAIGLVMSAREWLRLWSVGRMGMRQAGVPLFMWPFAAHDLLARRAAGLADAELAAAYSLPDHTALAQRVMAAEQVRRGLAPIDREEWLPEKSAATVPPSFASPARWSDYAELVERRRAVYRSALSMFVLWMLTIVVMLASLAAVSARSTEAISIFNGSRYGFAAAGTLFVWVFLLGAWRTRRRAARILLLRPFGMPGMSPPLRRIVVRHLGPLAHVFTLSDRSYRPNWFLEVLSRGWGTAKLVLGPLLKPSFRLASVRSERSYSAFANRLGNPRQLALLSLMCRGQALNIKSTYDYWKRCIHLMMNSCDVVVMDVSKIGPGSAWEIDQLSRRGMLDRCVFLAQQGLVDLTPGSPVETALRDRPVELFYYDRHGWIVEEAHFREIVVDRLRAVLVPAEPRPALVVQPAKTAVPLRTFPVARPYRHESGIRIVLNWRGAAVLAGSLLLIGYMAGQQHSQPGDSGQTAPRRQVPPSEAVDAGAHREASATVGVPPPALASPLPDPPTYQVPEPLTYQALLAARARLSDSDAMVELAKRLFEGTDGPADPEQGTQWLKLAAEADHVEALRELALSHETGRGVPVDADEAADAILRWLAKGGDEAVEQFDEDIEDGDVWGWDTMMELQRKLRDGGHYRGNAAIDGIVGPATRDAIRRYIESQSAN